MNSCSEKLLFLVGTAVQLQKLIDKPKLRRERLPGKGGTDPTNLAQLRQQVQFVNLCRVLALFDDKLYITRKVDEQVGLVSIARQLHIFFHAHILTMKETFLLQWNDSLFALDILPEEACVTVSSQLVNAEMFELHSHRVDHCKLVEVQMMLRQRGARAKLATEELELDIPDEKDEGEEALDLDTACIIIQTWERVYQAVARRSYLVDVHQKAMDLHSSQKAIDPVQMITKIQARTRGYLTRKRVNEMREKELNVLGMSVESLLRSYVQRRSNQDSRMGAVDVDLDSLKICTSLDELLDFVHNTYYSTAPEVRNEEKISKAPDEATESLFYGLFLSGVIVQKSERIQLDELTSYPIEANIAKTNIFFDLRSIVYLTIVIPHMLSGWRVSRVHRRSVIFVGGEKSGKTAWTNALIAQCAAPHILVGAKTFRGKGAAKMRYKIEKFAASEPYSIVVLDRLELFTTTKKKTIARKNVLTLLENLKGLHIQIIGMSRSAHIDEDILSHFTNVLNVTNPDRFPRFGLIADRLSRRLAAERLPKIPPRLSDLCKETKQMSCGAVVAHVVSRTAK